jgi:hypothetical protein
VRDVRSQHPSLRSQRRASRLEATVVIVHDVWALIGASTFRRRGPTFDGGAGLVFTDTQLIDGRSPAMASFQRALLAARLGVRSGGASPSGTMPDPTFVRLTDDVEALHVIRERLLAGGLGTIERLGTARHQECHRSTGAASDLANPEARTSTWRVHHSSRQSPTSTPSEWPCCTCRRGSRGEQPQRFARSRTHPMGANYSSKPTRPILSNRTFTVMATMRFLRWPKDATEDCEEASTWFAGVETDEF